MKKSILLFAAALSLTFASAQDYGQAYTMKMWDNASAPHSNGITTPQEERHKDCIYNTSTAELFIFPADTTKATGQAVVICPGGGYSFASMNQEGYLMARWFAENGITAAVLKYRMPNGHPEVPVEDVERAVRIMAGLEAGATGFPLDKVGVVGFSAGGHLAAAASTISATKPGFAILFYAVIDSNKGHQGSFRQLLGENPAPELLEYYSLQNRVTPQTPPTMLLLTDDDTVVPPVNSTLYYQALKANGVKASMHIYPRGGHGWGAFDSFPYQAEWRQAVLEWLKGLNTRP